MKLLVRLLPDCTPLDPIAITNRKKYCSVPLQTTKALYDHLPEEEQDLICEPLTLYPF